MYTAEPAPTGEWFIMVPDTDYVCTVSDKGEAAALLSHLNRG